MAKQVKNIEELLYYKALVDSATMRYHLLAECCRLQRNFETALRCYSLQFEENTGTPIDVEEYMIDAYEYPTEK